MSSNGLDLSKTRNLTIENCDFSYPQYEGGGGNGYGMNICGQETLIKNCSSTSARHSFSFKYAYANGNVIYHYTSTDPKYGSDFHMYLSMSNLIDNEELNGDYVETNVRPYGGTAGNRHGYTSTQTVFWNTKGNRYKSGMNYIIDSRQFGYGYIIGTQGAATAVKTTPTTMSSQYGSVNTAPEDYKEGIGLAATLYPQSLYYDQLAKRLGKEEPKPEKKVVSIPGTFNATDYSTATNGISTNITSAGKKYVGNLTANSTIEYKTNIAKLGKYRLDVNAVAGNSNSNRIVTVYLDDKELAKVPVVNKTNWEDFQASSVELQIPYTGEHTLKIVSTGSANISDIIFTKIADETTSKVVTTPEATTSKATAQETTTPEATPKVTTSETTTPKTTQNTTTSEITTSKVITTPEATPKVTTSETIPKPTQNTTTSSTTIPETTKITTTSNVTTTASESTGTVETTKVQVTTPENTKPNITTPGAILPTTSKLVSQIKDGKQVEQEILSCKNDEDPKDATFGKLCLKVKKSNHKSIKLTWRKVKGGTTYVVYGAKCGKSYSKIGSVSKNTFTNKKLKKGTYYKYMVVAQDSKGKVITMSKLIHVATSGGKVGNCKKIKVNKSSIILKSNGKFKLKVKQIATKKNLKIKQHRKTAFESTNEKVAVVLKNGVIQAKGKGKCLIYVYAQNGVYKKIKIKVLK